MLLFRYPAAWTERFSEVAKSLCTKQNLSLILLKCQLRDNLILIPRFHGLISREETDTLVSGQSGCYLVRESQSSPGSFALSMRYGEWPYGLRTSVILLNKCSVLRRQC